MKKKRLTATNYNDYIMGIERNVAFGNAEYLKYTAKRISEQYDTTDPRVAELLKMCKV